MNLFNDLNDNLSDFKENLDKIIQKIEKNSKQIKDQTQIKVEIGKVERELNSLYQKLGEKTYRLHKGEVENLMMEEIVKEIDASISKLEGLKTRYEYIKSFEDRSEKLQVKEDKKYFNLDEKE